MRKAITLYATALALGLTCGTASAAGNDDPPPRSKAKQDYERGTAAIKRADWNGAITAFSVVIEREPKNADAWNWLGYANRKSGKLDAAFKAYDQALTIKPDHRGAHEYIGEAYLMTNNPAKAEEHLATLAKLCNARCEEYEDLQKAIAEYKAKPK